MKMRSILLVCLSALPAGLWGADADKEGESEVSQAGIQSAIQLLRSEYIRGTELDFTALNRAALDGLLLRLQLGATLVPNKVKSQEPVEPRILSAKLAPGIGWVRPLTFQRTETDLLRTAVESLRRENVTQLILDLRSPCSDADFDTAAEMLDLFVPPAEVLFKLQQEGRTDAELFLSREAAAWTGDIITLIDSNSCNAAEAIAAVLDERDATLLVGTPTRGATVRYEVQPIDREWSLKFARAEMLLPDGTSLFKKGLAPQFPVPMNKQESAKARKLQEAGKVAETVFDQARVRYNEAALVARKNPELDAYIRRSAGEETDGDREPSRDRVLQTAVDMLRAKAFISGGQFKWNERKPEPAFDEPEIPKALPADAP